MKNGDDDDDDVDDGDDYNDQQTENFATVKKVSAASRSEEIVAEFLFFNLCRFLSNG